jgi:hypothetical protein
LCADLHSVCIRSEESVAFSPEEFLKRTVRWVVRSNQPFSLVDDEDFRSMLAILKPDAPVHSAGIIKREVMRCYREEAVHMGDRLRNVDSKISITLDCWTSPNSRAFLGVTAHYIDAQWTSHSLVLDFLPLYGAHSGGNLCEALVGVFDRVGILPKLLGVTSDNAANVNKLLVDFERACSNRGILFDKSQQHVRCILHVLNLSVQTLLRELKAEAVDDDAGPDSDEAAAAQGNQLSCIANLRHVVTTIRNSPQRRHGFHRQCDVFNVPRKELIRDVCTRWGSTYDMLQRACEFRQPLSVVARLSPDLPELGDDEWDLVKVSIQLLVLDDTAPTM